MDSRGELAGATARPQSRRLRVAPLREDDGCHGAGDGPPPQRTARGACGGRAKRGGGAGQARSVTTTEGSSTGGASWRPEGARGAGYSSHGRVRCCRVLLSWWWRGLVSAALKRKRGRRGKPWRLSRCSRCQWAASLLRSRRALTPFSTPIRRGRGKGRRRGRRSKTVFYEPSSC